MMEDVPLVSEDELWRLLTTEGYLIWFKETWAAHMILHARNRDMHNVKRVRCKVPHDNLERYLPYQ